MLGWIPSLVRGINPTFRRPGVCTRTRWAESVKVIQTTRRCQTICGSGNVEQADARALPDDTIVVVDVDSGRTLECFPESTVSLDGVAYTICSPIDQPVMIATMSKTSAGERVLEPVDDADVLNSLLPKAVKELAADEIQLMQTGFFLTAVCSRDDMFDEDAEAEGEEADHDEGLVDDDDEGLDDDDIDEVDDQEEARVLSEFFVDGEGYFLCASEDPVLLLVRKNSSGEFVVPPENERAKVQPTIERMLEEELL
mmetsp:Transcript_16496/g.33684  ORF Transcript_16496/g.33684 Transcript_16496/m.33684 type:complete len:255 (-) Transcript_16496:478-1242(-)